MGRIFDGLMFPIALRCVMVLALAMCSCTLQAAAPAWNVLFVAVDDLGNVLLSEKDRIVKTPNLDRLCRSGVYFERAYCQIPLCNPSRASFLTGLRPDTTGVFDLTRHFRETVPEAVTLPQLFKSHGWFTARVGKIFHYDVPKGIGTDGLDDPRSWNKVINPLGRDVTDEAFIINPTPEKPISAALSWLAAEGDDDEQTDGMIANEAVKLIEEHATAPFFIAAGFFRPHTPYVAPKKYFELYPIEHILLPASPADDRVDIPPAALAHNNLVPHYGLDEATCRKALQAYYASVTFFDAQLGKLLDALDRLQLSDRTIVVLMSDHGYHLGEHGGVWQKRTLFEESSRAPLVVRLPKAEGNGKASKRIVEFIDVFPTLIEIAQFDPMPSLQGRSLVPLLKQPDARWDSAAVTQILRPAVQDRPVVMGRSIRTERYRYSEWNNGELGVELYDHGDDPHEFRNLDPQSLPEETRLRLKAMLNERATGYPPSTPFEPAKL